MDIAFADRENLTPNRIGQIRRLFEASGWTQRQVDGQIGALERFLLDPNSAIFLAIEKGEIVGYSSVQFYSWNRLGQIHGLVVHPGFRQKGIGSQLVDQMEQWLKTLPARGVYVDTPADNRVGIFFYLQLGYRQECVFSEYYDAGQDGIFFLKKFT